MKAPPDIVVVAKNWFEQVEADHADHPALTGFGGVESVRRGIDYDLVQSTDERLALKDVLRLEAAGNPLLGELAPQARFLAPSLHHLDLGMKRWMVSGKRTVWVSLLPLVEIRGQHSSSC